MAMRLPVINGQTLFTVDQIELLRRLRNSGLSKEQVVAGFESIERLEKELGPIYNIPLSQITNPVNLQRLQVQANHVATQLAQAAQIQAQMQAAAAAASSSIEVAQNVAAVTSTNQPQSISIGTPMIIPSQPVFPGPIAISGTNLCMTEVSQPIASTPMHFNGSTHSEEKVNGTFSRKRSTSSEELDLSMKSINADSTNKDNPAANEQTPTPLPTFPQLSSISTSNITVGETNSTSNNNIPNANTEIKLEGIPEISDTNEEYVAFLSKGERVCCEEIKEFVQKYNIRQQQIATLSGISQPYISRFLRGEFSEMSPRSRRVIIKWYIQYKNYPTAIAPAVNAVLLANGHPPAKRFISSINLNNGDFLNTPRRERFVFRPNHVEILEKHFTEDSYPSYAKREEIARILNATTEAATGKALEDREIVTAQIVSNWFANKRKEMKKIAKEGLDVSQVPLRPQGRPARRFNYKAILGNNNQVSAMDTSSQEQATDLSMPAQVSSTGPLLAADLSLGNSDSPTDLSINNQLNGSEEEGRDGNLSTPDFQVNAPGRRASCSESSDSLADWATTPRHQVGED